MKPITVRAFYRAATVSGFSAPWDTLNMKVHYPCDYSDSAGAPDAEAIPPDKSRAPYPVVIMLPGTNTSHESYGWLARRLAEAGFVVLTYDWITRGASNAAGIGPGVETKRLKARNYGGKPPCPALRTLFKELKKIQKKGVLAGLLNLDKVILGGHSAGGAMALINANPDWFPQVRGAFSYAAHTAADPKLGWKKNSIMPLNRHLPMLIMGGTRDGVMAAANGQSRRKGEGSPTEWIERTFHEGLKGKQGNRHLVIVKGANHFSLMRPQKSVAGESFLDMPSRGSKKKVRKYLARLVVNFCDHVCTGNAMSGAELQSLTSTDHPLAAIAKHK